MAKAFGILVVAEGVEQEEVKRLTTIGCGFIHGYYYSKPLPAEDRGNYLNIFSFRTHLL